MRRLRKFFPKIETVSDAVTHGVQVKVTETDSKSARKGNFKECALAKAACRELKVDGALIGITYSYLVKGTHATRYKTPESVQREIVSFDRHHDFDEGTYSLRPISPAHRLSARRAGRRAASTSTTKRSHIMKHATARVRRVKG